MVPLDQVDRSLVTQLRNLGDAYGGLGVALAAAQLTDPALVVSSIRRTLPVEAPARSQRAVSDLAVAVIVLALLLPFVGLLAGVAWRGVRIGAGW